MDNKDFKNIPGYNGVYKIDKSGNVISCKYGKTRLLKYGLDRRGYCLVCLHNIKPKTHTIHRLVMLTFIGDSKLQVNHKNGIKTDNRLENLEYCTNSENQIHKYKVLGYKGIWANIFGKDHFSSKPVIQINKKGQVIGNYENMVDAKYKTGISNGNIGRVCKGQRKTAGGFIWKFIT